MVHVTERDDDGRRGTTSAPDGGVAVIRREERLRAGVETVPLERVRLEKRIVEEQRTVTVTVRREEVRLVREALDPDDTAALDQVHGDVPELVLHEERVEVTTRVVPVERVRLRRDRVTRDEVVSGEVRSERIRVEGAE